MKDTAIFAAGCFWGVQYYFDQVPGVLQTTAGYTGGQEDNPSYWEVAYKKTGHAEALKIEYDPSKVTYETLIRQFFRMHDPTQLNKQGPDVGDEYRSAIFYLNEDQKTTATKVLEELNKTKFNGGIATKLEKATKFWPAEEEHQKFTQKTGIGMCHIDYTPV